MALASTGAAGGVPTSPTPPTQLLTDMLLDGLEGMKARISDPEGQRQTAAALVKVIDLALKAG
ncbi:hypothetical protein [Mesorhizobium sp. B2-4-19]|uniref:hypothetical protein n=1 Tax=Mesorhizobium sp. B2-4-19 TaxID=2589930 RepID=UPI001FEDCFE9|nr:hypothetical protein [Mesorhizobium sp. B2-4-19]